MKPKAEIDRIRKKIAELKRELYIAEILLPITADSGFINCVNQAFALAKMFCEKERALLNPLFDERERLIMAFPELRYYQKGQKGKKGRDR